MDDVFWSAFGSETAERFRGFDHLMPFRVQEILLVSSMYDAFTLEEGGRLTELLLSEYRELNLSFAPHISRVSTGEEALQLLHSRRFDLVLTMTRLGDMEAAKLARSVKDIHADLPVYALAFNPRELQQLERTNQGQAFDRIFLWSGDVRLLLAIIKHHEDQRNAGHDTKLGDVRVILLIEDSIRFYSSYLPLLYVEVLKQTLSLMDEGWNLSHRLLRMRARPKILLASTFEAAWTIYEAHKSHMLGVICDGRFPWNGQKRDDAGVEFVWRAKEVDPHMPAVLQSSSLELAPKAQQLDAGFIHKNSPRLLRELRNFMLDNFGFGDFVFRMPTGDEVGRASDLRTLAEQLAVVPQESIAHHAQHDHFSNWLRARAEFALARLLRPRKTSEFADIEQIREFLIATINRFRAESQRGIVADFSPNLFDSSSDFVRIGGGSLGGKGRGLAFMNSVLNRYQVRDRFPDVIIEVPRTAVIGTDVFDEFIGQQNLRELVLSPLDDQEIVSLILNAKLPPAIYADLETFLEQVRYPLAVRSSSMLEDSQYQPFAGVYSTYMLGNSHDDLRVRLDQLCDAIKLVYASTFTRSAKSYIEATGNRVEEEKMAVIVQQVVGRRHDNFDYPDFAGVGLSTNFYPAAGLEPEDGVACVALGLGCTVVEGGKCLRFSPGNPQVTPGFETIDDMLKNSQRIFKAVNVGNPDAYPEPDTDFNIAVLELSDAERHGTLEPIGSVYSHENNVIYDGIHRPGARLVSFAHVLKSDIFPLAAILKLLLELGQRCMSAPVEIEFAVALSDTALHPHRFGFLQIRPLVAGFGAPDIQPELLDSSASLIATSVALGNGRVDGIRDVVYVPRDRFDRGKTMVIADQVAALDRQLREREIPYLLIGPGRWGSADRWLGIPVRWDQISGAQVIVETDLEDFKVTPSQGSHFFQNLTSFQIAYLTVNQAEGKSHLDWDWLDQQPAVAETEYLRHLHFDEPLLILVDGRSGQGVVCKPGVEVTTELG